MNRIFTVFIAGILLCLPAASVFGVQQFDDFTVRESAQEGESVELVALDAGGNKQEALSATLPFSINGFEVDLKFHAGRALFPRDLVSSTFLYVKYEGQARSITRLFYVYPGLMNGFSVLHIPLVVLVVIPFALVVLGMFFRRLIILFLVLLAAFFFFNSSKGLSLESFFDAVREWLGGILQLIIGF